MSHGFVIGFRQGVSLVERAQVPAAVQYDDKKRLPLDQCSPCLLLALRALSSTGATEEHLIRLARTDDDLNSQPNLAYYLDQFARLCLLKYSVLSQGTPIASVIPAVKEFRLADTDTSGQTRFCLSRFAFLRRAEQSLILESPLSLAKVELSVPIGVVAIAELSSPRTFEQLSNRTEGLSLDAARNLLSLLAGASFLTTVDTNGNFEEDANLKTKQWEFHDLLFHWRSRSGKHSYMVGGTYPFLDDVPPSPVVKPLPCGEITAMYKPDLEKLMREDLPFTKVVECRKSVRGYSPQTISVEQLGEFLFRSARVREVTPANPGKQRYYDISNRPYPGAGAAYELEIYLAINRCTGVTPGIHHYDPLGHRLTKLLDYGEVVEALLRSAQASAASLHRPQILIIFTARFQRLSWKYRGLTYAAILKDVGALYQTMYLVATAIGLAPCALGTGNSGLVDAIQSDFLLESPVGEFILGVTPSSPSTTTHVTETW